MTTAKTPPTQNASTAARSSIDSHTMTATITPSGTTAVQGPPYMRSGSVLSVVVWSVGCRPAVVIVGSVGSLLLIAPVDNALPYLVDGRLLSGRLPRSIDADV